MELKTLDLYGYFGCEKSPFMDGILQCYLQKTDVVAGSDAAQLTGIVTSCIFKGVHFEMLVQTKDGYELMVQDGRGPACPAWCG